MKPFMDKDFLLTTDTAKHLYHDYAAKMPIIDYHCHIEPEEIANDRKFENITKIWLGGDHYKWRLMRANGIDESYITGDAPDREKFQKWAETLEKAIGNPLYHWSHLELQRYFDYHGVLNKDTAEEVWNLCNAKLKEDSMSARNIIRNSDVRLICTTDDPISTLEYHQSLKDDPEFNVKVLPAWRPDNAVNIEKPEYLDYIAKLSSASNTEIKDFDSLCKALKNRLEFFDSMGCKASDHGIEYIMYKPASNDDIEFIFKKKLTGESLSELETLQFKTALLLFLGKEYHNLGWAMQLHYGVKRNTNSNFYKKLGPDTGFDCINNHCSAAEATAFLNTLHESDQLPKTIIYSLNPTDNALIGTIINCFQGPETVGKIQQGSAWWFNDHKSGMIEQMTSLASVALLGNFVGMLTDSRSFLSYTRHEYFRRILCDLIGNWVENGEYPNNDKVLENMVKNICYNNCRDYFEFPVA